MVKVAIYPASTETGLEVVRALTNVRGIEIYSHDKYKGAANLKHIELKDADYIYPTTEQALKLRSKKVVSHPLKTIQICENKLLTYQTLPDISPSVYGKSVWAKPETGHSGIGQYLLNDGSIYVEHLPGKEYTIDCYSNQSKLMYIHGRERKHVKAGISTHNESFRHPDFKGMADYIASKLKFTGAWFFQVKENDQGELRLLEVGARISGNSSHSRAIGVNLPLLHLYQKMGIEVEIPKHRDSVTYRSLRVHHDLPNIRHIYVDWDDCLMIDGKINHQVMAFIYKQNKPSFILTRGNNAKLIHPFKSIIKTDDKFRYSNNQSLLIDDSYSERKEWKHSLSPQQLDLYL